jgi:nitrite reductase/ring-hydroxylating ferredoxin subunit
MPPTEAARRPPVSRHVVATVDELPPGARKVVTVRGRPIAVFNVAGEFFGVFNLCPHQGGSLCEGALMGLAVSDEPGTYQLLRKGEMLRCPWHGWEFDIRTGQSWCDPETIRTRSYAVKAETGEELVKGPYVAETFPVTVDQNYVILEMKP